MISHFRCTMVASLAIAFFAFSTVGNGQDQEERQQRRQNQRNQLARQILEQLKDAELTEEQTAKIRELATKYQEKMNEAQQAVRGALTNEIRQKRNAVLRKAREEGMSNAEAQKLVAEEVPLDEETAAKLKEAQAQQRTLRSEFAKELQGVLTEEQFKAVNFGNRRNANRNRNRNNADGDDDGDQNNQRRNRNRNRNQNGDDGNKSDDG